METRSKYVGLKDPFSGRGRREIKVLPKCPHQHLKVVEFIGFVGLPIDLELGFCLLVNATVLEKMIVNPSSLVSVELSYPGEAESKEKRDAKQLQAKVAQGVEYVIL